MRRRDFLIIAGSMLGGALGRPVTAQEPGGEPVEGQEPEPASDATKAPPLYQADVLGSDIVVGAASFFPAMVGGWPR